MYCIKLLGRVALGAQRPIVVKLSRGRSVGRSVCLSSTLWKNGGWDPDAVRHRRSDGSRDEAGSGVWGSVYGNGYFWGEFGARHCPQRPIGHTTCATTPRRSPLAKLLWADLLFKLPKIGYFSQLGRIAKFYTTF